MEKRAPMVRFPITADMALLAVAALLIAACAQAGPAPQQQTPDAFTTMATTAAAPSSTAGTASVPPPTATPPLAATVVAPPAATVGQQTGPPPPTPPPADVAPPGSTPEITLADDGRTLQLAVSQEFLLKLGGGWDWQVEVSDPAVLRPVVDAQVPADAQGLYRAIAPGQATLTAAGDPPCRKTRPPCMMPSRIFSLAIVVR